MPHVLGPRRNGPRVDGDGNAAQPKGRAAPGAGIRVVSTPPLRAEQPIPALSRTQGFTNRFMPLAGGSAFLQPLSPFHCLPSFFFLLLTFMGKGLEGEASENTMN